MDCHNWQYEVQGTKPVYAPQKDLEAHGSPSHPQRETVHGRAMLDVTPADEFMPGAVCEDCHMPKTNKAATRYSHGMKPMLPGDAEKWMTQAGASYMGEDSCSGCHVSQSRTELQASIDDWQTDTVAAAADAKEAIEAVTTAATPPAEFSMTDDTKAGYKLIGRATFNYKVWENDASDGVHNPEYIVAGLEKATAMAKSVGGSFAQITAPKSVVPGGSGFISGKVVNGDGSAAAGATVELADAGVVVATTTADEKGVFAFPFTVTLTDTGKTFSIHWARSADMTTHLMSADIAVAVAKETSKTTIAKSASTIKVNKSVKITGKVTPAAAGQTVRLKYRKGSNAWKTVTLTLDAASAYAKSIKLTSKGTWSFQTFYDGTTTVAASKTGIIKVTVK
jgi:hypothetical protein